MYGPITSTSYLHNDREEYLKRFHPDMFMANLSPRAFDVMPTRMSMEFERKAEEASRNIMQYYSMAGQGKLDGIYRYAIDSTLSSLYNIPYDEIARNHNYYVAPFTGGKVIEDKAFIEAWGDAFKSQNTMMRIAKLQNKFDKSKDEDERRQILEDIELEEEELLKLQDFSDRSWLSKQVINSAPIINQSLRSLGWAAGGAAIGAGLGLLTGGLGSAAMATGLITKGSALAKAAGAISGKGGAYAGWRTGRALDIVQNVYAQERGSLSRDIYKMVDEDGNRIPDDIRNEIATIGGIFIAIVEVATPEPGFNKAFDLIGLKETGRATVGTFAKKYVRESIKNGFGESLEEGIQSIIGDVAQDVAKNTAAKRGDVNFDQIKPLEDPEVMKGYLTNAWESFKQAFIPSMIAGAPGTALRMGIETLDLSGRDSDAGIMYNIPKDQMKQARNLQEESERSKFIPINAIKTSGLKVTDEFKQKMAEYETAHGKLPAVQVKFDKNTQAYVAVDIDNEMLAKYLYSAKKAKSAIVEVQKNANYTLEAGTFEALAENNNAKAEDGIFEFATNQDFENFFSDIAESVTNVEKQDDGSVILTYNEDGVEQSAIIKLKDGKFEFDNKPNANDNMTSEEKYKKNRDLMNDRKKYTKYLRQQFKENTVGGTKQDMKKVRAETFKTGVESLILLQKATGLTSDEIINKKIKLNILLDNDQLNTIKANENLDAQDHLRGWMDTNADGSYTITLTNEANASTISHEVGHVMRRLMSNEDLQRFNKAYGIENGGWLTDIKTNADGTYNLGGRKYQDLDKAKAEAIANEEQFVEDFLAYCADGSLSEKAAPLREVFQQMKKFIHSLLNAHYDELSKPLKEAFNNLFANDHSQNEYQKDYTSRAEVENDILMSLDMDLDDKNKLLGAGFKNKEIEALKKPTRLFQVDPEYKPKKTILVTKIFKVIDGELYPLYIKNAGGVSTKLYQWLIAEDGDNLKSGIGKLAKRIGWHALNLIYGIGATHIGKKKPGASKSDPPSYREKDQVVALCEMPYDVYYGEIIKKFASSDPKTIQLPPYFIPYGGHFGYKTQSNMTGSWAIGGAIRIVKLLTDEEVHEWNKRLGTQDDLPREPGYTFVPAEHGLTPDMYEMNLSGAEIVNYDFETGQAKDPGMPELTARYTADGNDIEYVDKDGNVVGSWIDEDKKYNPRTYTIRHEMREKIEPLIKKMGEGVYKGLEQTLQMYGEMKFENQDKLEDFYKNIKQIPEFDGMEAEVVSINEKAGTASVRFLAKLSDKSADSTGFIHTVALKIRNSNAYPAELKPLWNKAVFEKQYNSLKYKYNQKKNKNNFMKAPNGKMTNLTEHQWLSVRTIVFKNWFGDWENNKQDASKILDENGEPNVLYHGSGIKGLEVLDNTLEGARNVNGGERGLVYATDSQEAAEDFAYERLPSAISDDFYQRGERGDVYPLYMNIRNPLDLMHLTEDDYGKMEKAIHDFMLSKGFDESEAIERAQNQISRIRDAYNKVTEKGYDPQLIKDASLEVFRDAEIFASAGYDGLICNMGLVEDENATEYAAIKPSNVKSATLNDGTYDSGNDSSLFQIDRVPEVYKKLEGEDNRITLRANGKDVTDLETPTGYSLEGVLKFPEKAINMAIGIAEYLPFKLDMPKELDKSSRMYNSRQNKRYEIASKYLENAVEWMTDNVKYLYDQVPAEQRKKDALWYERAYVTSMQMAAQHHISLKQAAAIVAVLSPTKEWSQNVSLAERYLDIIMCQDDYVVDDKAFEAAEKRAKYADPKYKFNPTKLPWWAKPDAFTEIEQKALRTIPLGKLRTTTEFEGHAIRNERLMAAAISAFDIAYNDPGYKALDIEKGVTGFVMTKSIHDDEPEFVHQLVIGQSAINIMKVVSIYYDGSKENISEQIGKNPKVRSFYNNIAMPWSDRGEVTADTHAGAGAYLLPLGSGALEIDSLFGGYPNAANGYVGMSPLVQDAFRRVAERIRLDPNEEVKFLPRQIQSIAWERARLLFLNQKPTANTKESDNKLLQAKAIWSAIKPNNDGIITSKEFTDAEREGIYNLFTLHEGSYNIDPEFHEGEPNTIYERRIFEGSRWTSSMGQAVYGAEAGYMGDVAERSIPVGNAGVNPDTLFQIEKNKEVDNNESESIFSKYREAGRVSESRLHGASSESSVDTEITGQSINSSDVVLLRKSQDGSRSLDGFRTEGNEGEGIQRLGNNGSLNQGTQEGLRRPDLPERSTFRRIQNTAAPTGIWKGQGFKIKLGETISDASELTKRLKKLGVSQFTYTDIIEIPTAISDHIAHKYKTNQLLRVAEDSAPTFIKLLKSHAHEQGVFGKRVDTTKTAEEYNNIEHPYDMYISADGGYMFAISDDGDIVSVCSSTDACGVTNVILPMAVALGGDHLDCFANPDDDLPSIYSKFGFVPITKIHFNREFMPDGWDPDNPKMGDPDIIFMAYDQESALNNPERASLYQDIYKEKVTYTANDDYDVSNQKAKDAAISFQRIKLFQTEKKHNNVYVSNLVRRAMADMMKNLDSVTDEEEQYMIEDVNWTIQNLATRDDLKDAYYAKDLDSYLKIMEKRMQAQGEVRGENQLQIDYEWDHKRGPQFANLYSMMEKIKEYEKKEVEQREERRKNYFKVSYEKIGELENFIDNEIYIPDPLLQRYAAQFPESAEKLRAEIQDRELMMAITDKERSLAAEATSVEEFIKAVNKDQGTALDEDMERVYRKYYKYSHTETIADMKKRFIKEFHTLPKLLTLKNIIGKRFIPMEGKYGVPYTRLYVPTSKAYQAIRNLTENSTQEDVDKVLKNISDNPIPWLRAYYQSMAGIEKMDGLTPEERKSKPLDIMAKLEFLNMKDDAYALVSELRKVDDDASYKKDINELLAGDKGAKGLSMDDTYSDAAIRKLAPKLVNLVGLTKARERTRMAIERGEKRLKKLTNVSLTTHDAKLLDSCKYIYFLMKGGQMGKYSADYDAEMEALRRGEETEHEMIFFPMDANGNEIEDGEFTADVGTYKFDRKNVPVLLSKYLADDTYEKITAEGFLWKNMTLDDINNLKNALIAVRRETKSMMDYKNAIKREYRSNIENNLLQTIYGTEVKYLINDNIAERVARKLEISVDEVQEADIYDYIRKNPADFFEAKDIGAFKEAGQVFSLAFAKIQRVAQWLDGGKPDGAFQNTFVRKPFEAYQEYMKQKSRRIHKANEVFDSILGKAGSEQRKANFKLLTSTAEYKSAAVDGHMIELTGFEQMSVYMNAWNVHGFVKLISTKGNNLSLSAVAQMNPEAVYEIIQQELQDRQDIEEANQDGSGIKSKISRAHTVLYYYTEDELQQVVSQIERGTGKSNLAPVIIQLAESMFDMLYEEHERNEQAAYDNHNMIMTLQRHYFPLAKLKDSVAEKREESTKAKNVASGHLKARVFNRDYPILLDPFSVFYSAIESQEMEINMGKVVKDLHSVLDSKGGNIQQLVDDQYGVKVGNYLRDYVNRLAGTRPDSQDLDKLVNKFFAGVSVSKLMNFMTPIKQLLSIIPATTSGEINGVDFIKGCMAYVNNKEDYERILNDYAPEFMLQSNMEYEYQKYKDYAETTGHGQLKTELVDKALWLTEYTDKAAKVLIWVSAYEKNLNKGMSTADAAYRAGQLIQKTQSVTNPISQSPAQGRTDFFSRLFFMFTNDMFQMWNVGYFDARSDFKNKKVFAGMTKFLGIGLTSMALAFLSGAIMPDKDDDDEGADWKAVLMETLRNITEMSIPLAGAGLELIVKGTGSMLWKGFYNAAQLVSMGTKQITGKKEYDAKQWGEQAFDVILDALEVFSFPAVQLKRTIQTFYDGEGFRFNPAYFLLGTRWGRGFDTLLR